MKRQMTDAEVWGEIAEQLAGAQFIHMGLCLYISELMEAGAISYEHQESLRDQLRAHFYKGKAFYWSPGAVSPRIRACRILMRECLKREGR